MKACRAPVSSGTRVSAARASACRGMHRRGGDCTYALSSVDAGVWQGAGRGRGVGGGEAI